MSNIWTQPSGTELARINEGEEAVINLPVAPFTEVTLITGNLPPGLSITGTQITGVPGEVPRETNFRFVLRARYGSKISDRTFSIVILGADDPEWITEPGLLPIGKNENFFILDSSPVDFQFEVEDTDLAAGQELKYFIASGDGELPPGINLSESGRLSGIVDPILALERRAGEGTYDDARFDRYPYDFALREGGRYDSFFFDGGINLPENTTEEEFLEDNNFGFDSRPYDFNTKSRIPKKLNRYFEFKVSVSDGDTVVKRTFRIFVVGDDFLRADNTIMQVGTGIFTSDNTFLRTPVWLTPFDLGFKRANNFITLFLEVIDTNTIPGFVTYNLETTNPGRYLILESNEEVQGFWEISGEFPEDIKNNIQTTSEDDFTVIEPETVSELPPGTEIDQSTGEVFGRVPYQTAVTKEYKFTVNARRISSETTEIAESRKTFSVKLIGEIDSTIVWLTDPDLGSVPSNYVSTLKVQARSSVPDSFLLYSLESGELPPGLTLAFTGEIFGKIENDIVNQDQTFSFEIRARDQFGFSEITRTFNLRVLNENDIVYSDIYYKPLLPQRDRQAFRNFVADSEIFDPSNVYRINDPRFGLQQEPKILVYAGLEENDIDKYVAATAKTASRKTLRIRDAKLAEAKEPGTNTVIYEVVYLDLFDPYEKNNDVRKKIRISNSDVIKVNSIRKSNDFRNRPVNSFSVGTRLFNFNQIFFDNELPIETRSGEVYWLVEYDTPLGTRQGDIEPEYFFGSSTNLVFDPQPENTITADSDAVKISDVNDTVRYVSNISNLREELSNLGATERSFLPLWMRTAQKGSVQELGYTLALPLAYFKPGTGERALAGIRNSSFDIRQLELEVDRLFIESTKDNVNEQYIVFGNFQFNLA